MAVVVRTTSHAAVSLLPFATHARSSHRLTAVASRIEQRKALFQGHGGICDGGDDNLSSLDRHSHALINLEVRRHGDGRRQSNAEIVSPLLESEHCFGHGPFR